MQEALNNIQTYGYIVLFVYSMGGGFVGLVASGVLSALGKLDLGICIVVACIGNILGSMLLAYLARYQKQDFQKYLYKHKRKIALVHLYLRRYGILLIFINKFIYGFKTILPLAIGLSRYSFKKFFVFNALACLLWAISIGLCAFYASDVAISVFQRVQSYPYVMPLFLVCLIGGIALLLWVKSKKKS